jgi:hypothetical protein
MAKIRSTSQEASTGNQSASFGGLTKQRRFNRRSVALASFAMINLHQPTSAIIAKSNSSATNQNLITDSVLNASLASLTVSHLVNPSETTKFALGNAHWDTNLSSPIQSLSDNSANISTSPSANPEQTAFVNSNLPRVLSTGIMDPIAPNVQANNQSVGNDLLGLNSSTEKITLASTELVPTSNLQNPFVPHDQNIATRAISENVFAPKPGMFNSALLANSVPLKTIPTSSSDTAASTTLKTHAPDTMTVSGQMDYQNTIFASGQSDIAMVGVHHASLSSAYYILV